MILEAWPSASGSLGKAELASTELEHPINVGRATQSNSFHLRIFLSRIFKIILTNIHPSFPIPAIMLILNFFLTLLSLLMGVGSAHADLVETVESTPAIIERLKDIQNQTVEMASVVKNWNGDILVSVPILTSSDSLLKAIEDGTNTATGLPKKMTTREAIRVKRATKELLEHINSSLNTIVLAKRLFDDAGLTSTMLGRLEQTKEGAEKLNAAIVEKLPAGKGIARRLGRKISAAFDSAIAEFSKEKP